jgi:hypothetical protein
MPSTSRTTQTSGVSPSESTARICPLILIVKAIAHLSPLRGGRDCIRLREGNLLDDGIGHDFAVLITRRNA